MPNTYTQLASDSFTRANETPLSGGGNWYSAQFSNLNLLVFSNSARPHVTGNNCSEWWSPSKLVFPNNQYAEAKISITPSVTTNEFGVLVRAVDDGTGRVNGYSFKTVKTASGANYVIQRFTSIIPTTLLTIASQPSPVIGDITRLEIIGTTLTAFYNGVQVGTVTDSTYASGQPGLIMTGTGSTRPASNSWDAGSIVAPPAYYSVPDCRVYATFPNKSRNVNRTLIYDVQTSSNSSVPSKDCRISIPVACGMYPQNCRTPGVFGPGE